MFVLSAISGPTAGQSIRLVHGGAITIGSGWEANFHFDDPKLSKLHAEISWNEAGFSVLDLSSQTGTFVNGTRIRSRVGLRVGDHLQLGDLIFQLKEVAHQEVREELKKTSEMLALEDATTDVQERSLLMMKGHTVMAKPLLEFPTIDGEIASQAKALRVLVSSPESVGAAKIIVHREDRIDPVTVLPLAIGREQTNTVVLDDPGVSVRHAVIEQRKNNYILRDVGSSNGTFVNGKRIVEHKLQDGDIITCGSHNLLAVIGSVCLGIEVQPPVLVQRTAPERSDTQKVVIAEAFAAPKKKAKKRAAELIWYATSDLDKGVFRARAAIAALLLGIVITGLMLAKGDSEVLAGSKLASHHEDETFLTKAEELGRDRCTACHVGVGQVSTLKCFDCHPDARPSTGHVVAEIECAGCHREHNGESFRSTPAAARACSSCHPTPHEKMIRERPKLVATFSLDAPAGIDFHLKHQAEGVRCLQCHGEAAKTPERGVRGSCRQCHAPDHVTAEDCRMCHRAHPDRAKEAVDYTVAAAQDPPRFRGAAILGALGLVVVSFLGAALLPRKRKVER